MLINVTGLCFLTQQQLIVRKLGLPNVKKVPLVPANAEWLAHQSDLCVFALIAPWESHWVFSADVLVAVFPVPILEFSDQIPGVT